MTTILIIDSDPKEHQILSQILDHYSIESIFSCSDALEKIRLLQPDLILLGIRHWDFEAYSVIRKLCQNAEDTPLIVLSCTDDTEHIVKAVQSGAFSFISKPYNTAKLVRIIDQCIASNSCVQSKNTIRPAHLLPQVIGSSRAMKTLRRQIHLFSQTDLPILITGESGSGKELVASSIHHLSSRRNREYRIVHCGAIPFSLFEAELYGSERGAFTGAVSRAGYFEQADKGSLFLDEIGEMAPEAQVKFLRILEDKEIIRIGGRRKIPIDVRIISATNRILPRLVRDSLFRPDLYFRINTLNIEVPPLRDHPEDIPLLVRSFISHPDPLSCILSREAMHTLMQYSWPGNVRQLKNVLARAGIISGGAKIEACHLNLDRKDWDETPTAAIS